MKTELDKYVSEQMEQMENSLQVDNWGVFQSHFAMYKRKRALRFAVYPALVTVVAIVIILSGEDITTDTIREWPGISMANNAMINTEITKCAPLANLAYREKNAEPMQKVPDKTSGISKISSPVPDDNNATTFSYDAFEEESLVTESSRKRQAIIVGLSGGPGILSRKEAYTKLNTSGGILAGGTENVHFRHLPPVNFGLSLGLPVTDRLSVVTGLDYSLYLSQKEIKTSKSTQNEVQQLHYLGIPIKLNYSICSSTSFVWYIGGGLQLEQLIYGKTGNTILKENNILCSARVSTGVQYNITDKLSVYFEPYCSYLLSGSALHSYHSDNPLFFSINLGLRFQYTR